MSDIPHKSTPFPTRRLPISRKSASPKLRQMLHAVPCQPIIISAPDRISDKPIFCAVEGFSPRTVAAIKATKSGIDRSEEHTSELQSRQYLVCRLLLEKKTKV